MRSPTLTLGARYIFPVEGPPIADGLLTLREGRIAWLGPAKGQKPDLDLGNVAITPGFINAHTHLELSPVEHEPASPSNGGGTSNGTENELSWLRRVVEQRRSGSEETLREAIDRNLAELLAAGTTSLADTTTAGLSWSHVSDAPVRGIVFAELIGLKRARGLMTNEQAWRWLGSISRESQVVACARPGLSPHAPYSTSGWLYHKAVASRLPLSTHLAEMPEELELLESRDGPLRRFLEEIDAWDDEWEPIGPRPAEYIRRGELRRADWLIAHGTYLDATDFWQLRPEAAPKGHRVALAYCPRTHARFGHAAHPYRALLERGVVVCLGTDSRASSPSLSILDEVRFLHRHDESLNGQLLLTMATLFGAWAMRAETLTGSLKLGKSGDLAVIALPDRDEPEPHNLLLKSDLPVVATVFEGRFVHGPWTEMG
jgi:cytosine/adenosine deaminase-related metal-dependent hydrolase